MKDDQPVAAPTTASGYPAGSAASNQDLPTPASESDVQAKWQEPPTASETVNLLVNGSDPNGSALFLQVLKTEPGAVMNAIRKLDWRDRVTATQRMPAISGGDTEMLLRAMLTSDRSKHVREAAVQAIEQSGLKSCLRDFAIALHDRHADVRREAGMAFFRQSDARSVSPLAEAVGTSTSARSKEAVAALRYIGLSTALPEFVLASRTMDPTEKLAAVAILRRQRRRLRRAGIPCSIPSNDRLLADALRSTDPDVRAGAEGITAYLTLPRASDPRSAAPPGQLLRPVRRKVRILEPSDTESAGPDARPSRLAWWDIRRWFGSRH